MRYLLLALVLAGCSTKMGDLSPRWKECEEKCAPNGCHRPGPPMECDMRFKVVQ